MLEKFTRKIYILIPYVEVFGYSQEMALWGLENPTTPFLLLTGEFVSYDMLFARASPLLPRS
jgi:hypothetical protein